MVSGYSCLKVPKIRIPMSKKKKMVTHPVLGVSTCTRPVTRHRTLNMCGFMDKLLEYTENN